MTGKTPIRVEHLPVFAYGSLKRGMANHEASSRGVLYVTPAWTWGRLYALDSRTPALEVPGGRTLLQGTADRDGDEQRRRSFHESEARALDHAAWAPAEKRWRRIKGELVYFPDPVKRLRILDALEGFVPSTGDPVLRSLIPVHCGGPHPRGEPAERFGKRTELAWAFLATPHMLENLKVLDMEEWTG